MYRVPYSFPSPGKKSHCADHLPTSHKKVCLSMHQRRKDGHKENNLWIKGYVSVHTVVTHTMEGPLFTRNVHEEGKSMAYNLKVMKWLREHDSPWTCFLSIHMIPPLPHSPGYERPMRKYRQRLYTFTALYKDKGLLLIVYRGVNYEKVNREHSLT